MDKGLTEPFIASTCVLGNAGIWYFVYENKKNKNRSNWMEHSIVHIPTCIYMYICTKKYSCQNPYPVQYYQLVYDNLPKSLSLYCIYDVCWSSTMPDGRSCLSHISYWTTVCVQNRATKPSRKNWYEGEINLYYTYTCIIQCFIRPDNRASHQPIITQ